MSLKKASTIDTILALASKPSVSVFIDAEDNSDAARVGTPYIYDKKDKVLTIFTCNLKDQDIEKLLPLIKKFFEETGLILKHSQEEVLESYSEYYSGNTDKKTLEFFKDILPQDDFDALKMSLFMRSERAKGRGISSYKKDIWERFGSRGSNIANLCNAGYFEQEFMPLYNEVSPDEFNNYYELAVGKKAMALFVHTGMNQADMQVAFDSMVSKALNYHISDFRIHGFGAVNVEIIKEFLKNRVVDEDEKFNIIKLHETQHPTAIVYDIRFF